MNTRPKIQSKSLHKWKSVTVRLKEDELAILNNKLDTNGYETFSEFIHAWIRGQYPHFENNDEIERLVNRIRDKGIKDPLTGESNIRNIELLGVIC